MSPVCICCETHVAPHSSHLATVPSSIKPQSRDPKMGTHQPAS